MYNKLAFFPHSLTGRRIFFDSITLGSQAARYGSSCAAPGAAINL
jgi:hypothetical protein